MKVSSRYASLLVACLVLVATGLYGAHRFQESAKWRTNHVVEYANYNCNECHRGENFLEICKSLKPSERRDTMIKAGILILPTQKKRIPDPPVIVRER